MRTFGSSVNLACLRFGELSGITTMEPGRVALADIVLLIALQVFFLKRRNAGVRLRIVIGRADTAQGRRGYLQLMITPIHGVVLLWR